MIRKSFTIRLDDNNLSCQLAEDSIKSAKQFGLDSQIFSAVHGKNSKKFFEEEKIEKLLHKKIQKNPGVQGCFLSHYFLWKKCIDLKETICILEHDGVFIRSLPEDIEDRFTDILNLDPNPQYSKNYDFLVKQSLDKDINYFKPTTKKNGESQNFSDAGFYIGGAYGYCIKPFAAEKLIKFAKEFGALPADKHIGSQIVDLMSTSVTVVRLHDFFKNNSIADFSTTKNLDNK